MKKGRLLGLSRCVKAVKTPPENDKSSIRGIQRLGVKRTFGGGGPPEATGTVTTQRRKREEKHPTGSVEVGQTQIITTGKRVACRWERRKPVRTAQNPSEG